MTTKTVIGRTLFLTLSALSLVAVPAAAHEGGKGAGAGYERLVKRLDANKDGKLQVSELPARMATRFGAADTNKDGVITQDEFTAKREAAKKEHLAKVDTNKDGKVSPEERTAARQTMIKARFTQMDKNGDGQVGPGDVGDKQWKRLAVADTDRSGSVSLAEMQQALSNGTIGHRHHH
jgi:Ca2+-binding EF-hand superfamily protein